MKKTIAFLLSLIMTLSLLTACSTQKEPNSPNKGGNTSDPSNLKIGLVLTGSANDGGWNQMAADAASTVAAKYGCTVNFSESVATTDIENTIRGYADAGYDIVFICQFVDEIWKIICVWRKSGGMGAAGNDKSTELHGRDSDNAMDKKVMEEKRSLWIRSGCVVVLFLLFLWMGRFLVERDAGRAFMIYIAAVDIPLSVLVPAFAGRKRTNPGKLAKMAAEVIGGVLITCILSGCMDRSIEAVDYLRVVMISETDGGYEYTFVTDSLEGAESAAESEEREYPVVAESLQRARAEYDQAHDRSLDLSHVEYIVVDSEETLRQMYPELIKEFVTNYVEVVCTDSLYQGEASGSIRKYIAAHYKGECLATLGE